MLDIITGQRWTITRLAPDNGSVWLNPPDERTARRTLFLSLWVLDISAMGTDTIVHAASPISAHATTHRTALQSVNELTVIVSYGSVCCWYYAMRDREAT